MTKSLIREIDLLCDPVASARYWQIESAYQSRGARAIMAMRMTTQYGIAAIQQETAARYSRYARLLMGIA